MDSFYIDLGVSVVISLLKSIKGPQKLAQFKKVFLKVNTLIHGVYGEDDDFKNVWAE